ncbi:mitochondrial-processing peptidase subunit alpha-like [Paramacrobiotus metropolitanus]|uniref:mitochondrial-processing peptidase subunit alpha-like n=1 Tax=Paramacrobiotus metropolitanus TaxID=2943436 RepID=UPI0024458AC3|nr:mitochondrial-processing peptidase subunit alpha-like [Paramacrobiotus metropolitanus]
MHAVRRSCWRYSFRAFSTKVPGVPGAAKPIHEVPLSEALPGFPKPSFAVVNERVQNQTRVTTLSNGLRVASQPKFGQFCTIGTVIDAGSRYEVAYPSGISHFLEKVAFQSTKEFSGRDAILQELEKHGGICDCQVSRETAVYAVSVETDGYDGIIRMLNEVTRRMQISDPELADVRRAVKFDLDDQQIRHEQEPLIMEMIHAAAYRENTLGLPRICPAENIEKISRNTIFTYLSQYYHPSRMVIAAVGLDHDALVKSVEKYFLQTKSMWEEDPSLLSLDAMKSPPDLSLAQYTGGDIRIEKDLSDISMGPTPIPELVHFALGFESCSYKDPDFIPFCVLNILMGGGGSFSAGGPGKGMYTRLYLNVLNQYHWMFNATAYNHSYADTGLFCIHASADPKMASNLVDVIVTEFRRMTGPIEEEELDRAKIQLSSMLMMNLESRPVIFEDIGRQVLAYGHRKPSRQLVDEINNVTEHDIRRVAERMLKSKPSVAGLGDVKVLPSYSTIEAQLFKQPEVKKARSFSLFA